MTMEMNRLVVSFYYALQTGCDNYMKDPLEMGNLFYCVEVVQSYVAVKERFGKFDEVLEPDTYFVSLTNSTIRGALHRGEQTSDNQFPLATQGHMVVLNLHI